jgi:hypothetical protein
MKKKLTREKAVLEIARAYLVGAGKTERGELSSVTGLQRWETGKANHKLVDKGLAVRLADGVYAIPEDK